MHLFKWSNWEVFNTYTGRVVASFSGPGIAARLYAVWLGAPFDYEDMKPKLRNSGNVPKESTNHLQISARSSKLWLIQIQTRSLQIARSTEKK